MSKQNIFPTKICGSENLMVHKIRYKVTHKWFLKADTTLQPNCSAWRYNKVRQLLQNFDHGKNENTMINTLPGDMAILDKFNFAKLYLGVPYCRELVPPPWLCILFILWPHCDLSIMELSYLMKPSDFKMSMSVTTIE